MPCICEICTCGRHRCPHQPIKSVGEPCKLSEYSNVFKAHPLQPRAPIKPNAQPMQSGQFESSTTNRADYTEKPTMKPQFHQPEQYVKPQGDFQASTSYKMDYTEKQGQRAMAIRHEGQKPVAARFEGEPTYKSDYRQWDAQRTKGLGPNQVWEPPKQAFQGQTTQQHDYVTKPFAQPRSFKPVERARASDDPFPSDTTHRNAFVQHPLEKPVQREREVYQKPTAAMDGLTTFRRDYQGALGGPTRSCKPDNNPYQSTEPFEDDTTNRRDFRGWRGEKPFVHQHEPYRKPEGEMEFGTTQKRDFNEKPINRILARRQGTPVRNDAKFEGTTSYGTDFISKQGQRAEMPRREGYQPNPHPFVGEPTYKGHYVQHAQAPAQSFKPTQGPMMSDAKFDGVTNYNRDFIPKPIQVCPAARIEHGDSRFKFTQLDQRGHKLYTQTITPLNNPRSPMGQKPMALSVA